MTTQKGACCCTAGGVSPETETTAKVEQRTRKYDAPVAATDKHESCCGGETAAGLSPKAPAKSSCCG